MTCIDNTLGNLLIKHNDKWRGDYYLKDDLKFTSNKEQAGRFYFLKSGDTTIINGDRISVNLASRTLIMGDDNIKLIDRNQFSNDINSVIITNGSDNTDPITYESCIFLISDKNIKTALKYEWGMDLIETGNNVTYQPHNHPKLTNSNYHEAQDINAFRFYLERADNAITKLTPATMRSKDSPVTYQEAIYKNPVELLDGYKGIAMVVLLMIILILCIIITK